MTQLSIWTIYDHPDDYPDHYVARRFLNDRPTDDMIADKSLERLRRGMMEFGLTCLTRHPTDDPKIMETWF